MGRGLPIKRVGQNALTPSASNPGFAGKGGVAPKPPRLDPSPGFPGKGGVTPKPRQLDPSPGFAGKGGVAPGTPPQLPPNVTLPTGGIPGNPGFPQPGQSPIRPPQLTPVLANLLGKGGSAAPGFPPRDMGTGAPPFDPNNPRAVQQPGIGGLRPPSANPMQVGPFGGFSGDPKPAPGMPGSPFNADLTYAGGMRPPSTQPVQVGPFGGFSGDPKPATGLQAVLGIK